MKNDKKQHVIVITNVNPVSDNRESIKKEPIIKTKEELLQLSKKHHVPIFMTPGLPLWENNIIIAEKKKFLIFKTTKVLEKKERQGLCNIYQININGVVYLFYEEIKKQLEEIEYDLFYDNKTNKFFVKKWVNKIYPDIESRLYSIEKG
ncbi:MAG: hypothetical protein V1836_00040 [Candidatus Aenigmatarchaeota archaeon]